MNIHQRIWLEKHGETQFFLMKAIKAGFDIHHVDGDHSNNAPENLVLLYNKDHMDMHECPQKWKRGGKWLSDNEINKLYTKGRRCYEERKSGKLWREISVPRAIDHAKQYAKLHDLEWPIKCEIDRSKYKKMGPRKKTLKQWEAEPFPSEAFQNRSVKKIWSK